MMLRTPAVMLLNLWCWKKEQKSGLRDLFVYVIFMNNARSELARREAAMEKKPSENICPTLR